MGKNAHPPRGNAAAKKSVNDPAEDTSFIVFTNDNDEKKKSRSSVKPSNIVTSGNSKQKVTTPDDQAKPEDVPKKPSARELVAGASWTGKLPVNLLAEHCQKQRWEKPDYTMSKTPDGFSSMVILKSKNPKTQEMTSLPPFRLPSDEKHHVIQPSAVEARHYAAAYALFRVCSMRNIHMMMPPDFRDLWKGPFQDLKKQDVASGKAWMYEADPFLAQREREEAHAAIAKQRELREKEMAAKREQPGGARVSLIPGGSAPNNQSRGWASARKVEMGVKTRKEIERIVRDGAIWNQYQTKMSRRDQDAVIQELENLGFRRSHVEEAANVCKDKEEVLEWLLIHVPEDDLPKWSLPEGYVAGISFATGNLKREGAVKRLASGGHATEICEELYDQFSGDERKVSHVLQQLLLQNSNQPDKNTGLSTAVDDGSREMWDQEEAVLSSIYEKKFNKLTQDSFEVALNIQEFNSPVSLRFIRPYGNYPEVVPIMSVIAPLPAYIRLSIVRQALTNAAEEFLGQQMVFNIVDWVEHEFMRIVKSPGRLSDISVVKSDSSPVGDRVSNGDLSRRQKRHPRPINWQPGTERSLQMLKAWQEKSTTPGQQKMITVRQSLPAWSLQEAVVSAVDTYQVVIISGETGSGKSTQSVQFILDDLIQRKMGDSANIICTQPRRISALGLADRVADERCSTVGQEVGYAIRGESKQVPGMTKITFVTTGVLLRRLQTSGGSTEDVVAALADVSHVVVDEVHERSLDTDFLLALLRDVLSRRKDLKVILMSATLDAEVFEQYFGGPKVCGRVEIQGRTFPVQDIYLDDIVRMTGFRQHQQEEDAEQSIAGTLQGLGMGINYDLIAALVERLDAELGSEPGGILIFLPGTVEISKTLDTLRSIPKLHALPLHASLLSSEQRRVFPPAPYGKRKVIASTNVAETSITIEDIVAVIDTGRVKETRYDSMNNIVKLEEVWASRAACKQRRGRAGRTRPGKCFKLYTRNAETKMMERPEPEIRRVPLEQLSLSVKAMGVMNVPNFLAKTLTPPDSLAVEGALQLLQRMGALDADNLTALGRHMSMIPADLRCAKLMVLGALFGYFEPCVTVAAILTVKSPFVSPQTKREESKACRSSFGIGHGDVIADLRAYDAWTEHRSTRSFRDTRSWCDQNFLSSQVLNDISTTRSQYISSLKEIGFLAATYRSPSTTQEPSYSLLQSLLLSALHPQTIRIALPTQKYLPTSSGALAIDPESREIRYFDAENTRMFIHPSSTLFSAQTFPNDAGFLSYFNKVETSKVFVRELSPCGAYGLLMFGGAIELDTQGRGLIVDGWVRLKGWARIGVLVGRLRGILDGILERWIEEPAGVESKGAREQRVVEVVRKLVELEGMDR